MRIPNGYWPGPWPTDETEHDAPYQDVVVKSANGRKITTFWVYDAPAPQMADEIGRLTRELAEAREALRPFALAASQRGEHEPDYSLRQPVKLGDLRRARAMLARLDAAEG